MTLYRHNGQAGDDLFLGLFSRRLGRGHGDLLHGGGRRCERRSWGGVWRGARLETFKLSRGAGAVTGGVSGSCALAVSAAVTSFLSIDSSRSSGRLEADSARVACGDSSTERSRNLRCEVLRSGQARSAASPSRARSSLPDGLFIDALEAHLAGGYAVASSEVFFCETRSFASGALRRARFCATFAIASAMASRC